MKRFFFLIITLFVICSPVFGQAPSIMIDQVDGLTSQGKLQTNRIITFHVRFSNYFDSEIIGSTNGFRIYSPNGAKWDSTIAISTGMITDTMYDGGTFINYFSVDGQGSDTVGLGGVSFLGTGIPNGFSERVLEIKIGPIDPVYATKEICIDSSFYSPGGLWKWSLASGEVFPSWGGPYCYTVDGDTISTNQPPVLSPIGSQNIAVGNSLFLNIFATDPDGPNPTLSASPIPEGAYFIDSGYGFGQFVWSPTINQVGVHYVTFFAVDDRNAVDSEQVAIGVIAQSGGVGFVSLMSTSGLVGGNVIPPGEEVELIYKVTNNSGAIIQGMSYGIIAHSPDGANWGTTRGRTTRNTFSIFDLVNNVIFVDIDGQNADSLLYTLIGSDMGIPPGYSDSTFAITLGPVSADQAGKTVCIDTTFIPPRGYWTWSDPSGDLLYPGWDGERCFTIGTADSIGGVLTWLYPNHATQGDSVWVNFYGMGTRFTMGNPIFRLMLEDMVIDPHFVNIVNDTIASCLFLFNTYTPTGLYTAIYGNTFESDWLPDAFTIIPADTNNPEISWVHPNYGQRGDTIRVEIGVHNYNLMLDSDSIMVQFLHGFSLFTPLEMVIYDDTSMGVLIAIPTYATPGWYDLRISDGMRPEIYKSEAFRVEGETGCSIEGVPPVVHLLVSNDIERDSMLIPVFSNCDSVPYNVASGADWLSAVPLTGIIHDSVWVIGDGSELPVGFYESKVHLWIDSNLTRSVTVFMHVEGDSGDPGCDLNLSTNHLEFVASPNQGNPPCQVFTVGTDCPTYALTNSTWITIYPYADSTIDYFVGDTLLQPGYKVCTDISMLTPGHRYHDTILVFYDSLKHPETVFVDLQLGDTDPLCGEFFIASVVAWEDSGYPDSGAIFGTMAEATDGYDLMFDEFYFGGTSVYFPHEEYGQIYDNLAADFRSPIENGCKSWRISTVASNTGPLHLGMYMMNLPIVESYSYRLMSDSGHLLQADFNYNSYTFYATAGQTYSFDIEVCCNSNSCYPTKFTNIIETGKSYSYVIPNMVGCFGLSNGDEIGLFDKQTGQLVGATVYCGEQFPLSIPAWESDASHGLPGFIDGNDLEVRFYNKQMDKIFCTELYGQCLPFNSCSYGLIDSLSCIDCGDQFCADFPLESGRWQLVSVPVMPITTATNEVARCDVDAYFGDVSGIEILKDDMGNAYIPAYGVDDIVCISQCEGYNMFRTGDPDSLCFSGYPMFGISCMVQAGRWNMISYPLTCKRPIEWVLGSILNCIDIVMDDAGRVYIPGPRGVNTIGEMIPGKGYYLFLSCEANLTIEFPNCFIDSMPAFGKDQVAYQAAASGNVSHYQYTNTGLPFAVVLRDINNAVSPGDEIALFDGAQCVGAVQYNGEQTIVIPAWKGDDEHNLPGYTNGHPAEVRVFRVDGTEEILIESSADLIFGNDNYQAVSVSSGGGLPHAYNLGQNYPNPFNPATSISFSLPGSAHVRIDIFNTLGQRVKTIVDADYDAGTFDVSWNGTDYNGQSVSTGVYLYRIETGNFIETKKMLLMK